MAVPTVPYVLLARHVTMSAPLPKPHLQNIERDSERNLNREGYVRLDRNERVTPLPETAFREMVSLLTVDTLMAYPDAGGFASRIARATGLPEDHIAITPGSDGGIRRIFMSFVGAGDVVQMTDPTYAMYDIYTRMFEGRTRKVEYGRDLRLDDDKFIRQIKSGTRLVALANPDQPSGATITEEQLRTIVAKAASVRALCVMDEAYYPFHNVSAAPLVREFDNLLVVRSFSKLPGAAGLRLGCVLGQPQLIRAVETVRGSSEVSSISLLFGSYLLDNPDIAKAFQEAVGKGRHVLLSRVERLGLDAPHSVANFQLVRMTDKDAASFVAAELKKRGFLIKSGFQHQCLQDCIRVSVNGPEIMEPFAEALEEVLTSHRLKRGHHSARANV
jgi:histidinol-phosphate aminotransferase